MKNTNKIANKYKHPKSSPHESYIARSMAPTNANIIDKIMGLFKYYYENGSLLRAKECLLKAYDCDITTEKKIEILISLGELCNESKNYEEAINFYQRAIISIKNIRVNFHNQENEVSFGELCASYKGLIFSQIANRENDHGVKSASEFYNIFKNSDVNGDYYSALVFLGRLLASEGNLIFAHGHIDNGIELSEVKQDSYENEVFIYEKARLHMKENDLKKAVAVLRNLKEKDIKYEYIKTLIFLKSHLHDQSSFTEEPDLNIIEQFWKKHRLSKKEKYSILLLMSYFLIKDKPDLALKTLKSVKNFKNKLSIKTSDDFYAFLIFELDQYN